MYTPYTTYVKHYTKGEYLNFIVAYCPVHLDKVDFSTLPIVYTSDIT